MAMETAAKAFAAEAYRRREDYKVEAIALYGSMARKEPEPKDIDLLIVHSNNVFEAVQRMKGRDKCKNDMERVALLEKMLAAEGFPSLDWVLGDKNVAEAISAGALNTHYLHTIFFKDAPFRKMAIKRNENPLFYENILRDALIWNPESGDFDIPFEARYALPAAIQL